MSTLAEKTPPGEKVGRRHNLLLAVAITTLLWGFTQSAFSQVMAKGPEMSSIARQKQIALACKVYASDNDGSFPPSLDALFPKYLPDRAILVSLFKPGEAVGYIYHPGIKDTDPADTILLEDKFSPLKHMRVVLQLDGAAKVTIIP